MDKTAEKMRDSPVWKRFVSTTKSGDLDNLRRDLIAIEGGVLLPFPHREGAGR